MNRSIINRQSCFAFGAIAAVFAISLFPVVSPGQDANQQQESPQGHYVAKMGANLFGGLEFDGSGQQQRVDLYQLISSNAVAQDNSSIVARQYFLFKMDKELARKIQALEEADGIAYGKLLKALQKESEGAERELDRLLASGEASPDGPEMEEFFAPFYMLQRDYYELRRSRARDIAQMMTEEQIAGLRKGAMDVAIREFGGMFELYNKALAQSGVDPNEGVTPEQKKRIVDALVEYRIRLRELNAELFEKVLAELPPAQRDALLDAASIRELKK